VTSCPARWENQPAGLSLGKLVGCESILTGPINIEPVGEDYVVWSDADGASQPTVHGHREFDVMLRCVTRSQAGNKSAQWWLEKVRAALVRPSTITRFNEAGLAVLSMGKGVQFDAPFEERFESIASAVLRCTCTISDGDDATEQVLTAVGVESTLTGEDGSTHAQTTLTSTE